MWGMLQLCFSLSKRAKLAPDGIARHSLAVAAHSEVTDLAVE
jgi:hypothetical protein